MDESIKLFRAELQNLLSRSQDNFEKQLSYISAGALGISMAFTDNITGEISETYLPLILIISWSFLTMTLLINLFSHIFAYRNHYKTIEEIDNEKYDQTVAIKRNKMINSFNNFSLGLMILGIILIIIYISLNIL